MTVGAAPAAELERRISAALLRLRARAPFFAVLSMFAPRVATHAVPTAATDGRRILYNPDWLGRCSNRELEAVWLHEVLHAALLHALRRGPREPVRWNIAADIVVNGIVAAESGLRLPEGAIREPSLEHLPVEEIYALLESRPARLCPQCLCGAGDGGGDGDGDVLGRLAEAEAHWRNALRQAEAAMRMSGQGTLPAGLRRVVDEVLQPSLDWRSLLWRFLVRTPSDFDDFDRRLIHRGLYLEALSSERVEVYVAIDTSGSIDAAMLASFLGELRGIVSAYPHTRVQLFYADAALDGPHTLEADSLLPEPTGGGGTSFVPFFEAVEALHAEASALGEGACVYLTDGWGAFPAHPPQGCEVLWVVTPGGALAGHFPWGEVVRALT